MPDPAPQATPGQAAYEATMPLLNGDLDGETYPWAKLPQRLRNAWEAAADAANRVSLARVLAGAARHKAERDEAREELATCRERNAAIAVQLDQYRDERDDARAALHRISSRMPIGRHASPDECDTMRAIATTALEATP